MKLLAMLALLLITALGSTAVQPTISGPSSPAAHSGITQSGAGTELSSAPVVLAQAEPDLPPPPAPAPEPAPVAAPQAAAELVPAVEPVPTATVSTAATATAMPDAAAIDAPGSEGAADSPPDREALPPPDESCSLPPPGPLPAPGSPGAETFFRGFREPLPPAAVWNPPGRKRVGLQAGHWRVEEVPSELRGLGGGAVGGGRAEWEVNLDVARRTAALLAEHGVEVDVLPATVPVRYRAHVFVSLHADGDETGRIRGYKLARPGFSATPDADDRLLDVLYRTYGETTGLPRDDEHISRRMTAYYAFNSRRYCHAVAPGVPSAIVEMGFLTNAADRQLLLGNPDAAARGLARGLLGYLGLTS